MFVFFKISVVACFAWQIFTFVFDTYLFFGGNRKHPNRIVTPKKL